MQNIFYHNNFLKLKQNLWVPYLQNKDNFFFIILNKKKEKKKHLTRLTLLYLIETKSSILFKKKS